MSLREDICNNVATTIAALGSVQYATREPFKFEELSSAQFPACLIQTAGESREDVTIGSGNVRRQSTLTIQVFGFVKGATIDASRNTLIEAIEEGLDADRTRGGYALDTQVVEVETDEGAIQPYGGVVLTIEVLYTFIRGNA